MSGQVRKVPSWSLLNKDECHKYAPASSHADDSREFRARQLQRQAIAQGAKPRLKRVNG